MIPFLSVLFCTDGFSLFWLNLEAVIQKYLPILYIPLRFIDYKLASGTMPSVPLDFKWPGRYLRVGIIYSSVSTTRLDCNLGKGRCLLENSPPNYVVWSLWFMTLCYNSHLFRLTFWKVFPAQMHPHPAALTLLFCTKIQAHSSFETYILLQWLLFKIH